MEHYAGIDVSPEQSSVCVVDAAGRIVREAKAASEPEALVRFFRRVGVQVARIGLEAGPLSQWLHAGPSEAGLEAVLLETRHVEAALSAMAVKTDRKDARGIAQLLRRSSRPARSRSAWAGPPAKTAAGVQSRIDGRNGFSGGLRADGGRVVIFVVAQAPLPLPGLSGVSVVSGRGRRPTRPPPGCFRRVWHDS